MGTSTDAILLYGIPLVEGAFDEYDEDDPAAPQSGPTFLAFMGGDEDGVEIQVHQSSEFPRHFVVIVGSVVTAHRGYPKCLSGRELVRNEAWDAKLKGFVDLYQLATDGGPGWWMASWWS